MMRPKILVLAPDLPYPIKAGGHMRMVSIIEGLGNLGKVHIACRAPELLPSTCQWVENFGGSIESYPYTPAMGLKLWQKRVQALVSGSSLIFNKEENRFYRRQFARYGPDLVLLETPYLLRYAINWRTSVPLIVDYWGTSLGQEREFRLARGFEKAWIWLRWRSAKGSEVKYSPLVKNIVTVSKSDAEYFQGLAPSSTIWPIPIGMSTQTEISSRMATEDPYCLVFTGDMSFRPNIDAAIFFVEKILPKIRERYPKICTVLAGRDPSDAIQTLGGRAGVKVTGYVSDLCRVIEDAAVYVLPMRLGSGIRTKLLDVFRLGKALVTTSVGAEGLELRHNDNCLIADDAKSFAAACARLLQFPKERKRLGQNLKRMANQVYCQKNIEKLLQQMVSSILRSWGMRDGRRY